MRTSAIAFGPKTFPGPVEAWEEEGGRCQHGRCNAKLRMHSCVKMILKLVLNDDSDADDVDNQKAFDISNDGGNTQNLTAFNCAANCARLCLFNL